MVLKTDVCVIGAGSAGLSAAVGAAQMGAATILIEDRKMGGDCLNYGCVPSKSLIAAAQAAYMQNRLSTFGLKCSKFTIDYAGVHRHLEEVIKTIEPHDSVERMESLGIQVFRDTASFMNRQDLAVGDKVIRARRYIIATGSSPSKPVIDGLDDVPYFTNETIFKAERPLEQLLIIGGGPIGMEMAQAHQRLGSKVTVLQKSRILPRDDEELVDILRHKLKEEGVEIIENSMIHKVSFINGVMTITYEQDQLVKQASGTHLLVAAGRHPNVSKLHLERAAIKYDTRGIHVDQYLRTNNHRVYAIGDVIGQQQFTHAAAYHASLVLKNILFKLPAKVDPSGIPWVTYTKPELAHIGLSEKEAEKHHMKYRVVRFPYAENDRAQCEKNTEGVIKVILDRWGRIKGADICGANAGDILPLWILAISKKMKVADIAKLVLPYPTYGEISKSAAGNYFKPLLFSKKVRMLVKLLMHIGRR